MKPPISDIAYTPAVNAAQERLGSRKADANMEKRGEQGPWNDIVTPELSKFIAERDSLYLGTGNRRRDRRCATRSFAKPRRPLYGRCVDAILWRALG